MCSYFFLIFSLPLFIFLKEKKKQLENNYNYFQYAVYGVKKVLNTIRNIKKYDNLKNYLLAYFLYIDAVNTIIFFSGIFARKTLNLNYIELAVFFIIVQVTAMIGSMIFAVLGDKLGIKKSIIITLLFWTLIVFFIFLFVNENSFINILGYSIHIFFYCGWFCWHFSWGNTEFIKSVNGKTYP